MPSDEALEVENLFVNCRHVFSYRSVERYDFVYRCDFVRMVQLRLDTGDIRRIRRLEVVNMWKKLNNVDELIRLLCVRRLLHIETIIRTYTRPRDKVLTYKGTCLVILFM